MQATPQEMNKFVQVVDEFMSNYDKLMDPQMRTDVYNSRNSALIADYESATGQAQTLKRTIEATTGAWNAAKQSWANVTDKTSMVIGDAIDEIRSWFGYDPAPGIGNYDFVRFDSSPISGGNLGAFAAIQLPAAAWIAGIVSAAYLLNKTMNQIFISVEASRFQRIDPTLSRSQALEKAVTAVTGGGFFGRATLPLIAAGALAIYLVMRKR